MKEKDIQRSHSLALFEGILIISIQSGAFITSGYVELHSMGEYVHISCIGVFLDLRGTRELMTFMVNKVTSR